MKETLKERIKDAKNIIFHEVATHGEVTSKAMRVFIEHRISKEVFDGIVKKGMLKKGNDERIEKSYDHGYLDGYNDALFGKEKRKDLNL